MSSQVSFQSSPFSSDAATPRVPHPQYRPSSRLPLEVRDHCLIYFEEGLYPQAINLLLSLTSAGGSTPTIKPAFVPPPAYLGLLATLAIHPSFTNRAKTPDKLETAALALKYLRLVQKTVGPLNSNINDAFNFSSMSRRVSTTRRRARDSVSPDKEDADSIPIELANETSLWARADDFWHTVGWAFNCSVLHPKRWERWRMWLECVLGFLEDDWNVRSDEEREDSLIINYLDAENRNINDKRVVRAVFADGGTRSLAEFKEIWNNETKERKRGDEAEAIKKAAVKINIEEGDYGDFLQSSDDDEKDEPPSSDPTPIALPHPAVPNRDGSLLLGGSSALQLRLRLLSLLSAVAFDLPERFTPLAKLFDLYLTHIRPLPLPTFAMIISPPSLNHFPASAASILTQYIAKSLISASAPLPRLDVLDQATIEKYYLPWPANTMGIADNAKLGACVETLLRLFDGLVGLRWTATLEKCAEAGIRAREEKATKGGRRKGEAGAVTGGDRAWLIESGERIRGVLRMAREACDLAT